MHTGILIKLFLKSRELLSTKYGQNCNLEFLLGIKIYLITVTHVSRIAHGPLVLEDVPYV